MTDNAIGFISTFGYTPAGFRVTVSLNIAAGDTHASNFAYLELMVTEGNLTVNPPGVEVGEQSEMVTYIVRRAKPKDNTPIIGFYLDHPDMVHKWFQVYLNFDDAGKATAKQLTDAAGLDSINGLPLWTGDNFPDKTTMTGDRAQFFIRLPYPIRVVRKDSGKRGDFNGKEYTIWELVRIERADQSSNSPVDEPVSEWTMTWLIKQVIDWPAFEGVSQHAANAVNKLRKEGAITDYMLEADALAVMERKYMATDDDMPPNETEGEAEFADEQTGDLHDPYGEDIPF